MERKIRFVLFLSEEEHQMLKQLTQWSYEKGNIPKPRKSLFVRRALFNVIFQKVSKEKEEEKRLEDDILLKRRNDQKE